MSDSQISRTSQSVDESTSSSQYEPYGTATRGRARGRGRGAGRRSGRGRTSTAGTDPGTSRGGGSSRTGTRRARSSSSGSRGRGRGRAKRARGAASVDLVRVEEMRKERNRSIETAITEMSAEDVRNLLLQVVMRTPGVLLDIWDNMAVRGCDPAPGPSSSDTDSPDWCTCTHCRQMPTDLEKLCCRQTPDRCFSRKTEVERYVLDPMYLAVVMGLRGEIYGLAYEGDNTSLRHGGYTVYTLIQHKRLGAGNRRVIPSCVVWRIRDEFPEPTGQYTGFIPARLC